MASAPNFIANFDSATAMQRALAHYLHGKDFSGIGIAPNALQPAADLINRLPQEVREFIYIWSGWGEAVRATRLARLDAERIPQWAVDTYPRRQFPAVAIGSSNGALVHLWAALGIPWLPQTYLIPVRRHGIHPDEPIDDMHWAEGPGRDLLRANPQLQLHHMNDANQDRLMIQHMTYFRVKWLRLSAAYRQFLCERLAPGGTIFLVDCRLKWPTVKIQDRHYFQHGALGGATPDEFHHGSQRVAEYLERYGSHRRSWPSPEPTGNSPEAEWGFEPALQESVEELARDRGWRVRRIVFHEPEDVSPLVADLYRWWYQQRRIFSSRLLVESFLLTEPAWTLRTGSAPYWMTFNKEPSADALEEYIDAEGPFDEIDLMLFSHGVDSVGLVPIERWKDIVGRARKRSRLIGVDERRYPRDFAIFIRYHTEVKKIAARYPLPGPLTLNQLERFLEQQADRYHVQWFDGQQLRFGSEEPPKHKSGEVPQSSALQ